MITISKATTEALRQKAFDIRQEVFVIEQQVAPADEFDVYEQVSTHFVALDDAGVPVGAARWRQTDKGVKLERFAVKATVRGQGIGAKLVKHVLEDIQETFGKGAQYLYLHAQLPAVSLYEKFGFEKKGDQFLECDILHYLMDRKS